MLRKVYAVRLSDEAIRDSLLARGYKAEQITPAMILAERQRLAADLTPPKKKYSGLDGDYD